ncbi:hypothetical protein E2562_011454 [Oryza meyeriana var. granulata]|uniref:Uncharacterized protein n=1 Tax=Oryza meyeriana var. granulata TaxID=110450 RepID=A0A6G1D235_9ORYZ|nr:hypothetical protein E2562_011454 [Oryza meyeriana var. granulata]
MPLAHARLQSIVRALAELTSPSGPLVGLSLSQGRPRESPCVAIPNLSPTFHPTHTMCSVK